MCFTENNNEDNTPDSHGVKLRRLASSASRGFKDMGLIDSIRLGLTSVQQAGRHGLSWQGSH